MDMVFINQISTYLTAKVLMCSFKTLSHLMGTVRPGRIRVEFHYLVESQIC